MSGLMSITGEQKRTTKVGVAVADIQTGLYATLRFRQHYGHA
jgi:crotonobetainyl-CoA:carnitine CoA-transferase CaiB-like acyl-CoA transferase